jgi:NADPH2:quinone reductase
MPNMSWRRYGQCLSVPPALTMIEAAAMPETLFTVWSNVFERAYAAGWRLDPRSWRHVSGIGTMTIHARATCSI